MRFPPSLLDEIRTRVPISEVVGRRVKLKRAGRGLSGLCPFHQEKSASFTCDDGRQTFKCFGCGKGGDIFGFVMETEGVAFPEAVERLANQAGVALPKADPRSEEREHKRSSLYDVVEEACRFFEFALAGRAGDVGRAYLERRGISREAIAEFRLGYAPNARNALREHLAGKGISADQMIEAGLLVSGEDIPVAYDRFRDRVIFPIQDLRGRVVAFGGRALAKDAQAKYLNSPETPLFHKGALLFNAHRARLAAREAGRAVAVEGYVDVIACAAAGIAEVVAPLGTALTEDQLAGLWRMADEPILCLDGDAAGLRAAHRVLDLALPLLGPGKSLRFALLPDGRDPDDLVREGGASAMRAVLDGAEPLVERLWARERDAAPLDTPERRAALETRLHALVATIGHEGVRRHYSDLLRERVRGLFFNARPFRGAARPPTRGAVERLRHIPADRLISESSRRSGYLSGATPFPRREAVIVGTLLNHVALVERHAEEIAELDCDSRELDALKGRLLEIGQEDADPGGVRRQLEAEGFGPTIERVDRVIRARGIWQAGPQASLADAETGWRQAVHLQKKFRTLHREMKEAETALARDTSDRNLAWMSRVRDELLTAEGEEAQIESFGAASGRGAGGV